MLLAIEYLLNRRIVLRKIISMIALVLVIAAVASLAVWTEGFTAWKIRELNEDNLIKSENYVDGLDDKREDGLKIEVDEDGVITVEGENETEDDVKIVVTTVTLKAGEYTISSSAKGTDDKTYYLSIEAGDNVIIADEDEDSTFEVDEETTYTVYIVVCAGEEIDTTFKPVLVNGDEAGSFFVIG